MRHLRIIIFTFLYFFVLVCVPISISSAGFGDEMITWRNLRQTDTLPGIARARSIQRIGISVKLNLVKVQNASTGEAWIYNMDSRRFWRIDSRRKTFSEGSFKELSEYHQDRMLDEKVRLKTAKDGLAALDPQVAGQRAKQIEQRLALLDAPRRRFKATPIEEPPSEVAGFAAKPVGVYFGKDLVETFWVTEDFDPPAGWTRFLKVMSEIDPATWITEATLKQLPVKAEYNYGGMRRTWEINTLTPGPVSVDEFRIPTNYELTDLTL